MATIEEVIIKVKSDTSDLNKGMKKAEKRLEKTAIYTLSDRDRTQRLAKALLKSVKVRDGKLLITVGIN